MECQVVLWLALVHLAQSMYLIEKPYFESSPESTCIEYPLIDHDAILRMYNEGWRSQKPVIRKTINKRSTVVPAQFMHGEQSVSQRVDRIVDNFIPNSDILLKEHAKLVQDINSLRQAVFIVPFIEESRDYDDSIFHEIIETTATPSPIMSSTRYAASSSRFPVSSPRFPAIATRLPISSTKQPVISMKPFTSPTKDGSIPIILLGGASQRQIVKSQPINFAKPTVSLVGTSLSPSLLKHPYPFVTQSTTPRIPPVKICMKAVSSMYSMAKEPSLWDRLINFIIPSRKLGRDRARLMNLTEPQTLYNEYVYEDLNYSIPQNTSSEYANMLCSGHRTSATKFPIR